MTTARMQELEQCRSYCRGDQNKVFFLILILLTPQNKNHPWERRLRRDLRL